MVFWTFVEGYYAFLIDLICYGATGARKTFTMMGNDNNNGIIYFTIKYLYEKVYNESVYDLISGNKKALIVRVLNESTSVAGFQMVTINCVDQVIQVIHEGNDNEMVDDPAPISSNQPMKNVDIDPTSNQNKGTVEDNEMVDDPAPILSNQPMKIVDIHSIDCEEVIDEFARSKRRMDFVL
eukprot:XP_016656419.1 PREDICTED: kinesin-like protein KIF18B [Acyrthosiphon pisum]